MRSASVWGIWFVAALCGVMLYAAPDLRAALGATATAILRPVVIPIVELINVPAFAGVASAAILFAALYACLDWHWRVVRPRLGRSRSLRAAIRDLPLPRAIDTAANWPVAARRFGALLAQTECFIVAWSAWQSDATRRGAVPPRSFAHFVADEPDALDSATMRALPAYFTTFGLITTFLGLVVALYFAGKGFRSGNVEDARAAIVQLLHAASFKFMTSVAALVGAFGISLFLRRDLALLRHESHRAVERIDVFLTAWRAEVGTGREVEDRADQSLVLEAMLTRLDDLSAGIRHLGAVVAELSAVLRPASAEAADGARR